MVNAGQRRAVQQWLAEAPFDNPKAMAADPDFSYEGWLERGRRLSGVAEVLAEILAEENLKKPSDKAERAAYAIGWLGDKHAIGSLLRVLKSDGVGLRSEAVAALGRLGDVEVSGVLQKILEDEKENPNVRANACISIGRLSPASAETVLKRALSDPDPFVERAAAEGLRLLREKITN